MVFYTKQAQSNYLFSESFDAASKSFCKAAGIMSMLAILSPSLSFMATPPLVFLPSARIWVQKNGVQLDNNMTLVKRKKLHKTSYSNRACYSSLLITGKDQTSKAKD